MPRRGGRGQIDARPANAGLTKQEQVRSRQRMSSLTRSALRKVFVSSAILRVAKVATTAEVAASSGPRGGGHRCRADGDGRIRGVPRANSGMPSSPSTSRRKTGSRVLQAGLNEYLTKLGASQAMFNSVDDRITRREFENYANAMLKFSSSIQTLSWLPRVAAEERASVRTRGCPGRPCRITTFKIARPTAASLAPRFRTNISRCCSRQCRRRRRSTAST